MEARNMAVQVVEDGDANEIQATVAGITVYMTIEEYPVSGDPVVVLRDANGQRVHSLDLVLFKVAT